MFLQFQKLDMKTARKLDGPIHKQSAHSQYTTNSHTPKCAIYRYLTGPLGYMYGMNISTVYYAFYPKISAWNINYITNNSNKYNPRQLHNVD